MLECNLAVLLTERNLRITKVSKDTGISRTTLTGLCKSSTDGIRYDTLETLCTYLRVTPEDFFNYTAYNYDIVLNDSDETLEFDADIIYRPVINFNKENLKWVMPVSAVVTITGDTASPEIDITLYIADLNDGKDWTNEEERAFSEFEQMVNEMSHRQRKQMEKELGDIVLKQLENNSEEKNKELFESLKGDNVEIVYNCTFI